MSITDRTEQIIKRRKTHLSHLQYALCVALLLPPATTLNKGMSSAIMAYHHQQQQQQQHEEEEQAQEVESEDEPFVPPPTSWFENHQGNNNNSSSSSWMMNSSSPPGTPDDIIGSTCSSSTNNERHHHASSLDVLTPADGAAAAVTSPTRSTGSSSSSSSSSSVAASRSPKINPLLYVPTLQATAVTVSHPSPGWKELSSQVLPAAARELLSSSWRRIYYTARLSYAKSRKHRKHSDIGNNTGGIYLSAGNSSAAAFPFNESSAELPPFSSLNWTDRQLVREWRTYLTSDDDDEDDHDNEEEEDEDFDFARARALVPNPFPRPMWQKTDVCHQCQMSFGPTRLRHHCRMCGFSFCQSHSSSSHKLPHLGYDPEVPERVCDPCQRTLQDQTLAERVAWRLARCRDYSEGQLTPYFEMGLDSASEVAMRITKAAIAMAKSIPLGAQATVAVETVDVLRKYGLHGIYGIMLRQEFLAAADLLRQALGINKTSWPLSVHELSAAIFYALAQHRAMRGLHPEREDIIHTLRSPSQRNQNYQPRQPLQSPLQPPDLEPKNTGTVRTTVPAVIDNFAMSALSFHNNPVIDQTDTYNPEVSTLEHLNEAFDLPLPLQHDPRQRDNPVKTTDASSTPNHSPGFSPVCDPVPDSALSSLIFYAPIALNFVYATKEVDMQLLAAQQGWRLLYAYLEQDYETGKLTDRPASAVFLHEEHKTVCLAIRGTATIQDVITDIRQIPVPFPDQEPSDDAGNSSFENNDDDWTTIFRGQGLALCGMASAATNLFREHIDALMFFAKQGYRIRITGHSLGGGVATMIGVMAMRHFERDKELARVLQLGKSNSVEESSLLRVYAYGTPSCVDAKLAESVDSFVTTVVLHDDVFPRLTPTSCRGLLKHLLHIRETWVKIHMQDDLRAVGERAKTVWAPKFRQSFTLGQASSSTTIKKYCKKQFQKGKKKLLLVTEKIAKQDSKDTGDRIDDKNAYADAESYESDPSDWGERFFVPTAESSPQSLDTTYEDEDDQEVEERDDSNAESQPQFLLEFLGGVDNQTEGLVIDGEEFFDSEDKLIESDGEESVSTDCFRDPLNAASGESLTVSDSWSIEPDSSASPPGKDSKDTTPEDAGPAAVVLEEIPLPRMFVPGKVIHVYSHRGVYKAVYVPRTLRELRRISLAGNMLSDHTTKCYYEGLLEVQTARLAPETPPKWSSFDEDDTCCCCANRFTWASTSNSEAQEARDKHNCRSCGGLVCDPCAKNRVPIPSIGLTVAVRVCDRCYNDMGGHSVASSSLTSSFLAVDEDEYHSRDEVSSPGRLGVASGKDIEIRIEERPERKREKRSLIVDELASRMHSSTLTPCS
jgi:hypothetical protein